MGHVLIADGHDVVFGDAYLCPFEVGDFDAEIVFAVAGGDDAFVASQGAKDGFDGATDGVGCVGESHEDFAIYVAEYGSHLLHLSVWNFGPGLVGGGAVGHETEDVGMGSEKFCSCFCAGQGWHADEYFGGDAYIFYGLWAAFGVAVYDGLGGYVGFETLSFEFLAAVFFGVSLDNGYEPCAGFWGGGCRFLLWEVCLGDLACVHASGADSRGVFLCLLKWPFFVIALLCNLHVFGVL